MKAEENIKTGHTRNFLWLTVLLTVVNTQVHENRPSGMAGPTTLAEEICNWIDDDGDGQIDEGCKVYYQDADKDNFGLWHVQKREMFQPPGWAVVGGDCNDGNSSIHPNAKEDCLTEADDNCNGIKFEGCQFYFRDADQDGYGDEHHYVFDNVPPLNHVPDNRDCNDGNSSVYPGAREFCNNIDDDCDGAKDEGCMIYFLDSDKDGYGDFFAPIRETFQPPGYVTNGQDCRDNNINIHPGATEICNFLDDDCDGETDEGCKVYYFDGDVDGYGVWDNQRRETFQPDGWASQGGDCRDDLFFVNPGRPEICGNGLNDDCDGLTDEGCPGSDAAGTRSFTTAITEKREFNLVAYPTLSTNQFNILLEGNRGDGKITLRVINSLGRSQEIKNGLEAGQRITIGEGYPKGVYVLEAIQGKRRKTLKILKQ
jgi:hypothetical protein